MKLKHLIGVAGVLVCLSAWIALGVGFALHVDRKTWTILVFIAAFATEAMIWCLAAMLGLSLFQMRRKLWQWFMSPFTRNVESNPRANK